MSLRGRLAAVASHSAMRNIHGMSRTQARLAIVSTLVLSFACSDDGGGSAAERGTGTETGGAETQADDNASGDGLPDSGEDSGDGDSGDGDSADSGDGDSADSGDGDSGDGNSADSADGDSADSGDGESGDSGDGDSGDSGNGGSGDGGSGDGGSGDGGSGDGGSGDGGSGDGGSGGGDLGDGDSGDGDSGDGDSGDGDSGDGGVNSGGVDGGVDDESEGDEDDNDDEDDNGGPDIEEGGAIWCGNKIYECGDTFDNDMDGLIDLDDYECTTPCDDNETYFKTDLPGQNEDCKGDCYFDGNSGSGDDQCEWNLQCDVENPGEQIGCEYDPSHLWCEEKPVTSDVCEAFCEPLVPNGCDCFGCCKIAGQYVYLDGAECALDSLENCESCTWAPECNNPCDGECEICAGESAADLPPHCTAPSCPNGVTSCTKQSDCAAGQFCSTGCCVDVIPQ